MRRRLARGSLLLLPALALILAGLGCAGRDTVAGGGGVETTEGNLAVLEGAPTGARVSLVPAGFDPLRDELPDSLTVTVGADGRYAFAGLAPGRYNLDAYDPTDGTRAFRAGVVVGPGGARLPVDTLKPPGRLRLRWEGVRPGVVLQRGRLFGRAVRPEELADSVLDLDSLPAGVLPPFQHAASAADTARATLTDSVEVAAGKTGERAATGTWAHRGLLQLELPPGTAPEGSLAGYPLLVRLAAPAFPFAEARGDGRDLRVEAPGGAPLAHATERWDSAAGAAALWVRLPAEAALPFALTLRWGNPEAAAPRGAEDVFDTALGFTGVWHLAEADARDGAVIRDATPNRLVGIGKLLRPAPPDSAAIGGSQVLDGVGSHAYAQNVDATGRGGAFTASAWISPAFGTADTLPRVVIAKWEEKDSAGFQLRFAPRGGGLELLIGAGPGRTRLARASMPPGFGDGAWHHLAATFHGEELAVYWDGALLSRAEAGGADAGANSRDVVIGARGDVDPELAELDFFRGRLDEARLLRLAWPAERIRLDWLTQRPGSGAVRFEAAPSSP